MSRIVAPKAVMVKSAVIIVSFLALAPTVVFSETKAEIKLDSTSQQKASKPMLRDSNIEKTRGQLLYENNCGACHETSVHGRNPRKARTLGEIKTWVKKWSEELKINWPESDINEVTKYVNSKYYKY